MFGEDGVVDVVEVARFDPGSVGGQAVWYPDRSETDIVVPPSSTTGVLRAVVQTWHPGHGQV